MKARGLRVMMKTQARAVAKRTRAGVNFKKYVGITSKRLNNE